MKPEEAPSCREQGTPLPGAGPAAAPPPCAGCGSGIRDRFLLRANGRSWHERCLRCAECGRALRGRCFCRGRRLFCRPDYEKLFPRRCSRCLGAVGRSEPILRVLERIFHERCLSCGRCARRLRSGDQFVLQNGRILCSGHARPRPDAERLHPLRRPRPAPPGRSFFGDLLEYFRVAMPGFGFPPGKFPVSSPPAAARGEDEAGRDSRGSRNSGGKDPRRSKRPRTILSSQQRRAFKASFELSAKPCRKVRETLAAETGLTVRVVQVWFQNQRAKMKKIARRQQQQEQLGNSRGGIPGGRGSGRSGRDGNEDEEGWQRILVPFARIPPPPEPNGFGSEAGTFRGTTPPELRPFDSEGVFRELDGAALIPTENSQQLILGNAGIPGILQPRNALERLYPGNAGIPGIPEPGNPRIPGIPQPGNALERLYPGNAGIPGIPEPGNPMERLYSMQSSYFTS
ncbi:LIM homeobox transcription factor 1-beta-like [Anomalospiza imberbis]|uniref:LIM homeobox transcription factor 1-beta-like n=1 Tax=Anomalospiza imberbis TaxID=187417 RepID=UPI00358EC656